jgi:hypothetical protein
MKIGDYVKYDNDVWEIIRVDAGRRKSFISEKFPNGFPDEYLLNCKTQELPDKWVSEKLVTKTSLSQLYFDL